MKKALHRITATRGNSPSLQTIPEAEKKIIRKLSATWE